MPWKGKESSRVIRNKSRVFLWAPHTELGPVLRASKGPRAGVVCGVHAYAGVRAWQGAGRPDTRQRGAGRAARRGAAAAARNANFQ